MYSVVERMKHDEFQVDSRDGACIQCIASLGNKSHKGQKISPETSKR